MDNLREDFVNKLKTAQKNVERTLFLLRQRPEDGSNELMAEGNELADKLFDLRTKKDMRINSLRARTSNLLKRTEQFLSDYDYLRTNPVDFLRDRVVAEQRVENRGGRRKGAGRPSLGVKKSVTITLPQDKWDEIDTLIKNGKIKNYPDYFRRLSNGEDI